MWHPMKNVSHRRTVAEMRDSLPREATGFTMFRTGSGRPSNAFCHYTMPDGSKVARYHATDILTARPDGSYTVTFGGWHTIASRTRFNEAALAFGVPIRCAAVGKAGVTGFGPAAKADAWYPDKIVWKLIGRDVLNIHMPNS